MKHNTSIGLPILANLTTLLTILTTMCMLLFLNFKAYSQLPPRTPAKQWQKSFNQITYTTPAAGFSTDWTLDIIQTHDDSYIGVGFAGSYTSDQGGLSCTVNYNPAIYKLNGGGGLIWQKVEDDGHAAPAVTTAQPTRTDVGRFLKVIEVKEVGQDHYCYVAVGHKPDYSFSSAVDRSFICKYDEDGNLIGTVHYINLNASTITGGQLLTSVTHYVNSSGQDRYLFTGYKDYKMILFQTDNSFTEQPLATEVKGITINDNLPGTSTPYSYGRGFEVKVSYTYGTKPNGEPQSSGTTIGIPVGIYICGVLTQPYTYPTSTTLTQQNDAYTCKYNLSGVKQWGRVFASGTSDYWGGDQSPICISNVVPSSPTFVLKNAQSVIIPSHSIDDAAYSMVETSNGDIIVAMMYHKSDCGECHVKNYPSDPFYPSAKSTGSLPHNYVDFLSADAYLVMVDPNGNLLSSTPPQYVCHISGDDSHLNVKQTYDMHGTNPNFVIAATSSNDRIISSDPNSATAQKISEGDDFLLRKVEYDYSSHLFSVKWTKVFSGDDDGACGFALATTRDGGFIVAGNNDTFADDHSIVKLSNDCQARAYDDGTLKEFPLSNSILEVGKTITTGTYLTWNTPKIVNGTIVVDVGATLEITGTNVQFTAYSNIFDEKELAYYSITNTNHRSGIIVKPGGKLIVNHSTLTNFEGCAAYGFDDGLSGTWDGILLLGTPGIPMMSSGYQNFFGIAEFTGSSTDMAVLKNARYGITVGGGYGDGGIIKASFTTFKNNRKSVAFNFYQDPVYGHLNRSRFTDCAFLNDAPITGYSGRGTNQHVSAWGVRGINFAGCSFKNTISNALLCDLDRGIGIVSYDADIILGRYTISGLPGPFNQMEGLRTGIQSQNTGLSSPFYRDNIYATDFKNVQEGIILENNVAPNIKCNTFLIDNDFQHTQRYLLKNPYGASSITAYAYGLYTSNTTAFHSINNQFAFNNTNILSFGSITEDAGSGSDALNCEIKLHTINNNYNVGNKLHYGMEAIGHNGGLAVSCNTYLNLKQDWLIDVSDINPPAPTSCAYNCFPDHFYTSSVGYDPMNVFSINRSGTTDNILSNYKFTYYWKYSGTPISTIPTGFNINYPILTYTNTEVSCDYPCDGIYTIDIVDTDEGKRKFPQSKNTEKKDTLDELWKQGKFEEIAKLLSRSENPLNQKLVNLYDISHHTKFAKIEVKNSYTDFIANLPKERANKLTDAEILQLRNIAKAEPDYAIYAQNLISLNTGEIFKRLPIIAHSQINGKVLNNNEHNLNNNLFIYPNPTNDNITIALKDNIMMEGTLIEIYDYSGKRVLTKGLDHSFENIVLNVNQLSSGVYLLLYITQSKTYNSKFIIQK
ncbi:MAG: T9SS type A sorting domain-containing protein [Bacteroidia bacterium]|nr:T9SS type A sorting domain-containing protein [Bacteroidia bacterium]